MKDTALYKHLLGLEKPWTVERVELDVESGRVDVWTKHHKRKKFECPEPGCGAKCGLHDHAAERTWRHLDSCHFKTYLHTRPPRVKCQRHGVRTARLPWAEPNSRFTLMFERLAIDVLHEASVSGTARLLDLSWDEVQGIQERAVQRGLEARGELDVRVIGVDEKCIAKGYKFFTLVYDFDEHCVVHVAPGRSRKSLESFFETLEPYQMVNIEAMAMDMCPAFINVATECLAKPEEKIVFDRFHVMQNVNKAVDRVRREENRELRKRGDKRLTGTVQMWRYGRENLPAKYEVRFEDLKNSTLKTARAWAIKETLRDLWDCETPHQAQDHFKAWYSWAIRSQLEPIKKVAKSVKKHLSGILAYFTHPITNAISEGINSVIQDIRKRARGYANPDHFKIAILFRCGGLDLYPKGLGTS